MVNLKIYDVTDWTTNNFISPIFQEPDYEIWSDNGI